jgi:hypothetical protein
MSGVAGQQHRRVQQLAAVTQLPTRLSESGGAGSNRASHSGGLFAATDYTLPVSAGTRTGAGGLGGAGGRASAAHDASLVAYMHHSTPLLASAKGQLYTPAAAAAVAQQQQQVAARHMLQQQRQQQQAAAAVFYQQQQQQQAAALAMYTPAQQQQIQLQLQHRALQQQRQQQQRQQQAAMVGLLSAQQQLAAAAAARGGQAMQAAGGMVSAIPKHMVALNLAGSPCDTGGASTGSHSLALGAVPAQLPPAALPAAMQT